MFSEEKNVECGKSLVSLTNSFASCTCALVSTAPSGCTLSGALQKCFLLAHEGPFVGTSPQTYIQMEKKDHKGSIPVLHVLICSLKGNNDLAKC